MKKVRLEQVGKLLQAIYDTETHLKIEWLWDGGFEFAYGCMDVFNEHPLEVKELYKTIDASKIEEVASLILLEYELSHSKVDTNGDVNSMGVFIQTLEG